MSVLLLCQGVTDTFVVLPSGSPQRVKLNREVEEREGKFETRIQQFAADAVIDMICFTHESAKQLVTALR